MPPGAGVRDRRTSSAAHSRCHSVVACPEPRSIGGPAVLGRGHVGHRVLVLEALLGDLEVGRHDEDRPAVLAGRDPAGGEATALADVSTS